MKVKTLILIFLSLTMSISLWGYDFIDNGIYYNILSGNTSVEVTYGSSVSNSYSGSVTIPSSVSYSGKTYSVTSIGTDAFYNCKGLTSVTLPNSVTSIGVFAFENCTGLTSVTIPNSVTSIGNWAFSGCTGLTSVTIPNSVTSIGNWAFSGCTGLTSVTIPNSVTSIDIYAFQGCTGITAPIYNNTIFAYMPPSYSGSYTIPSGITTIAGGAFYNCTGLTSVTLPNSDTSIGIGAFSGCTGLTSVTLPNSVTSIGDAAFRGCTGITAPIYNNTIFAYMPTSYRGSYTIPSGITTIAGYAFEDCTRLTSVTLPNSVTSIGDAAFRGCTGLTSVTLPNSVTSTGNDAFLYCTGLTSVTLPNSVTSIGDGAFRGCTGLTSVTIPNSVTRIDGYAFYNTGLTSVYFKRATPPTIGSNCFINANPTYYVPCGTTSAYRSRLGTTSTIVEYPGYFVTVLSSDTLLGTATITQQPSCQQQTAVIQASAIPHYHFKQWSDGNTSNPRTVNVTGNATYTAVFEIDRHIVNVVGENGTVTGSGTYNYGTSVPLTATADEHYHFVGWSDGNTSSTRTIIVEGDTTYTAIFEIDKHNVTATTTNGTIAGLGEYGYGATVSLTAIPDDYYCHVNWSDGDTSLVKSFVITGDVSFSADFTKCQYVIAATCEHGTVTGGGIYENPDVVTLTVTPDEGYRFVKWSDDNEYNPRIFVARNDLTVEAICEEAPVIDDVENVQADAPAFYIIGNTIYNPDNELLRVYSAEGKLIKTSDSDVNMECYPKGIYMVVDNRGNAIKVPVR